MENWEKEFKRVKNNPIYFIELYYNKLNEEIANLTDEEKQHFYNKYKGVPFFDNSEDAFKYSEKLAELKKKGHKDWEIL